MNDAAHIRPLTGLRFFAAMWVVFYHYWANLQIGFTPALVEKGYLGVELFFVLSGFILCHVYLEGFGEGRFRFGSFLWNRLARVYPLHLATLLGVMALGLAASAAGMGIDAHILDWRSLPANLLLVQDFVGARPFLGVSWTLIIEIMWYTLFGVSVTLFGKRAGDGIDCNF